MKYTFIMLFLLSSFYLQAQNISGNISDAATGKKIEGASVKLLNSGVGAVTDTNGNFSLEGKGQIEVSFLGYKKIRIYW